MRSPPVRPAWARALAALLAVPLIHAAPACKGRGATRGEPGERRAPPEQGEARGAGSFVPVVPPVAPAALADVPWPNAAPDAGGAAERDPYDQATAYEAGGQLWLARLVLESRALSAVGAPREAELLARLCADQGDVDCVAKCEAKLGRKLAIDAGASQRGVLAMKRDGGTKR